MSAFDTLPDDAFRLMMPGLLALFAKEGWVVLVWGILFLPVGFGLQAIALWRTRSLPRWQSVLFLAGVVLIATPDGMELVNLTAAMLLAAACIPHGLSLIASRTPIASALA
jgi:hypothetical protein